MSGANTMNKTDMDERVRWEKLDSMTDEEKHEAALANPDAQPLTEEDFQSGRFRRTPQVQVIRRALRLSQEEFSAHFHIPVGTLRDWEQGHSEPDVSLRAYLKVIATKPDVVMEVLQTPIHVHVLEGF
jgi:putative transcriptional regulator